MLIDVTAQIMGDPSARTRREPLPHEIAKAQAAVKLTAREWRYMSLPVGGIVILRRLHAARAAVEWFKDNGRAASINARPDGRLRVERVR